MSNNTRKGPKPVKAYSNWAETVDYDPLGFLWLILVVVAVFLFIHVRVEPWKPLTHRAAWQVAAAISWVAALIGTVVYLDVLRRALKDKDPAANAED